MIGKETVILPEKEAETESSDQTQTASTPRPLSEWRDISTAPKDGTVILVWRVEEVEMVKWFDNGCNEWWSSPQGKHISRFDKHDSGEPDDWEIPTHWMPLPEPPNPQP